MRLTSALRKAWASLEIGSCGLRSFLRSPANTGVANAVLRVLLGLVDVHGDHANRADTAGARDEHRLAADASA
jgi:hypothetical protein